MAGENDVTLEHRGDASVPPLDPTKKVWGAPRDTRSGGATQDAKMRPPTQQQGMLYDPLLIRQVYDFLESTASHSRYGNFALETIAHSPFAAPVINMRLNQAMPFFRPSRMPNTPGYRCMLKMPVRRSLTTEERKEGDRLTNLLWSCGHFKDKTEKFQRDFFPVYARKLMNDSLTYDAGVTEIEPGLNGRPRAWRALDAATIFRTVPRDPWGGYKNTESAYVQMKGDVPRAYWPIELLSFWVRRPRTTMASNGYGYPELSELVSVLTGLTFGWEHNMNSFKNGMPRGITAFIGEMSPESFTGLQQQMLYAATGVSNAFRQTMVNMGVGSDVKFIPFGQPNREMEYNGWMNLCVRIVCATYQCDPTEVGIYLDTPGATKSLFPESPAAKYQFGRDKGFVPTMYSLQDELTRYVVEQLNEDFAFVFTGLDSMTDEERLTLTQLRTQTIMTIDEERALWEMDPMPDGSGQIIRDQNWLMNKQKLDDAKRAAAQQAAMIGMPGAAAAASEGLSGEGQAPEQPGSAPEDHSVDSGEWDLQPAQDQEPAPVANA